MVFCSMQVRLMSMSTVREDVCHHHSHALRLLRAQAWLLMFDSVDTVNDCIRIATGVLSTIAINPERMLAGLSADMLATDLAEYLVRKGAPRANCFK